MTTRPTETPPGEGSTPMALSEHANDANSGPVSGDRTPMSVAMIALAVLMVLVVAVIITGLVRLAS
jgi:hypothetical protein